MMNNNAGFWIRLGASILDGIVIGVPLAVIAYILMPDASSARSLSNVMTFLYGLILPVIWNGFTVGKRLCSIRIQKLDGSAPGFGTMLLRTVVGGLVYSLTFGICAIISAFMAGLREDKRTIHDFIAGTEVVHN